MFVLCSEIIKFSILYALFQYLTFIDTLHDFKHSDKLKKIYGNLKDDKLTEKIINDVKDGFNKEMLYISGENDMGAPAMAMEEMSHLTPNSKYICIPGAAHILNIEASDLVNKTILNFLN